MPETPQPAPPQSLHRRWWGQYLSNRRRIGTVAAILFALFLGWHAVNGRNGLTSWQQKRAEDKALAAEIGCTTPGQMRSSMRYRKRNLRLLDIRGNPR
jgi:hypothetical protein